MKKEETQMTHTSIELLPCPFCGAKAHFDIDDENWEWIECEGCGMQGNSSASLMEDCKPKLREAWNRRTPASQAQRVPLTDEQMRQMLLDAAMAAVPENERDRLTIDEQVLEQVTFFARATERAHGITQEKQE